MWSWWWQRGVYRHTFPLCGGLCIRVGDGQHLAQVASSRLYIWPWGLFMKAPARGYNLSVPDSQAQPCPDLVLTWHPQAASSASP